MNDLKARFILSGDAASLKRSLEESRAAYLATFRDAHAAIAPANQALSEAQGHARRMALALKSEGKTGEDFARWMHGAAEAVKKAKDEVLAKTQALQNARQAVRDNASAIAQAAQAEQAAQQSAQARIIAQRAALEASVKAEMAARDAAHRKALDPSREEVRARLEVSRKIADDQKAAASAAEKSWNDKIRATAAIRNADHQKALAETRQRSAQEVQASWNQGITGARQTLGLRPAAAMIGEIGQTRAALATLSASGALSASELAQAARAAQIRVAALRAELAGVPSAGNATAGAIARAGHSMVAMTAGALSAQQAIAILKSTVSAGLDFERTKTTLTFASGGDTARAGREMAFARSTANELGLALGSTTEAYGKLAAASKGTAIEGGQTREIFRAVASASSVMGLSAADTSGVLLAVSQMLSKGTVSAEELRGQLGERLPGAFAIGAKAMGMSTAELGKALEQGQIAAAEFLPKFATTLQASVNDALPAATQSARAQLQRLANQWQEFKERIAQSGLLDEMAKQVDAFLKRLEAMKASGELQDMAKGLADSFSSFAQALATVAQEASRHAEAIGNLVKILTGLAVLRFAGPLLAILPGLSGLGTAAAGAAPGVSLLAAALTRLPPVLLGLAVLWAAQKGMSAWVDMKEPHRALEEWQRTVAKMASDNADAAGEHVKTGAEILALSEDELEAYRNKIAAAHAYNAARAADLAQGGDTQSEGFTQYRQEEARYAAHLEQLKALDTARASDASRAASNLMAIKRGMLANLKENFAQQVEAHEAANRDLERAKSRREQLARDWAATAEKMAESATPENREEKSLRREAKALDREKRGLAPEDKDRAAQIEGRQKEIEARLEQMADEREAGPSSLDMAGLLSALNGAAAKARNTGAKSDYEAAYAQSAKMRGALEKAAEAGRLSDMELSYYRRTGEETSNTLSGEEQAGAQKRVDDTGAALAKLKAMAEDLKNNPITLRLATDPDNLDQIKSQIEAKLAGVQWSAPSGSKAADKAESELGSLPGKAPSSPQGSVPASVMNATPWDKVGAALAAQSPAKPGPSLVERAVAPVVASQAQREAWKTGENAWGNGGMAPGIESMNTVNINWPNGTRSQVYARPDAAADLSRAMQDTANMMGAY